jgi:hypothetical protein
MIESRTVYNSLTGVAETVLNLLRLNSISQPAVKPDFGSAF